MKNEKKIVISIKILNKISKFIYIFNIFLNKYYCRNHERIIHFNNKLHEFISSIINKIQ